MRIDNIQNLNLKCTGCTACVDACPVKCISSVIGKDGFVYTEIDDEKCINCGKCYSVCPIENKNKHDGEQHLFAAFSKDPKIRNNGSSGGIFELLAKACLKDGYYICGAAFDNLELKHVIINKEEELPALLKSKYVQSKTEGVYKQILSLLRKGEKVLFCGTPCQVSALQNSIPEKYKESLLTIDIICHGVPSQNTFNRYISFLRKKYNAEVLNFNFRVKDNRYRHAHGFSIKLCKKNKEQFVNGIYTGSSYYNAFKNYLFFRNSCYDCQYTTLNRVSDITLADFWGIEKYDFKGDVDKGVSMVITNSTKGLDLFSSIEEKVSFKEFPVSYGVESNHCLTHSTRKPKLRDEIIMSLTEENYDIVAEKYFKASPIFKIYWTIPYFFRSVIRKIRS